MQIPLTLSQTIALFSAVLQMVSSAPFSTRHRHSRCTDLSSAELHRRWARHIRDAGRTPGSPNGHDSFLVAQEGSTNRCEDTGYIVPASEQYTCEWDTSETHPELNKRAHCKWDYVTNRDNERYPKDLTVAKPCPDCSDCPHGRQCEPIIYNVRVLRQTGRCDDHDRLQYVPGCQAVTVGFACVEPEAVTA